MVIFWIALGMNYDELHENYSCWCSRFGDNIFKSLIIGWWNWSSICSWCSQCGRFCSNCWKWSVWRVRSITCTWNIRLSPRSQGIFSVSLDFPFYGNTFNWNELVWWAILLVDAWSQANWASASHWFFLDCCGWGMFSINDCLYFWQMMLKYQCRFKYTNYQYIRKWQCCY